MSFTFIVNPRTREVQVRYESESVEEGTVTLTSEGMKRLCEHYQNEAEGTADVNESTPPVDNTTAAAPTPAPAPKKPGRPKKNQPDPATATAPAPAPVPPSPGMNNPAPTPPSPPVAPTSPSPPTPPAAAPPPAPSYVLGNKIKAHIEGLATTDETKTTWRDWLASPGVNLVVPAATFDEAMGVLQFTTDAQAAPVAKALSLS